MNGTLRAAARVPARREQTAPATNARAEIVAARVSGSYLHGMVLLKQRVLPLAPNEPGIGARAAGTARNRVSVPRGLRYMAVGAFFFSVMSLLVKLAGRRLPSQELVLARSAVMLMLSWIGLRRADVRWTGANQRVLLLLRGTFGFAALSCFYYSIVRLPLGDANAIQYTSPPLTALLAGLVLGERLRWHEATAVAGSLAGVMLIARPSFIFGTPAALPLAVVGIALLGAFMSASAYVTVRRLEAQNPLVIIFYFSLVGVVGSIPAVWSRLLWPTPLEWLLLLAIGATTQVAQLYLTRGLQLERAGRATAVSYLQVIFAAILGMIFFSERPDLLSIAGFGLVVAGTLIVARSDPSGRAIAGAAVEDLS